MPAGVPVATLAIGKPGARNAGLLAVGILATAQPELAARLRAFREEQTRSVREDACREPDLSPAPRSACSAAASSDGCSRSRRGGWATASTRSRPTSTPPPARWPTSRSTPTTTTSTPSAPSPAAWTSSLSSSRTSRRRRRRGRRDRAGAAQRPRPAHHAAPRPREGVPAQKGFPATGVRAVDARGTGHGGGPRRAAGDAQDRGFGYDGKGQHRITSRHDLERVWGLVGHQTAMLERLVDFEREFSVVAARGLDGAFAHYGAIENTHRNHILDLSVSPARLSPAAVAEAVEVTRGDPGGAGLRRRAVRRVLPHREASCWSTRSPRGRTIPAT